MSLLPSWLRENFAIKAGMFVLACVLWFLVVTERVVEHTVVLPLELTGIGSEFVLAEPVPATVRVKLLASGKQLMRIHFINRPTVQLQVNTSQLRHSYQIKPDNVIFSSGITATVIEVVQPDSVRVMLAKRLTVDVPVAGRIAVQTAPGYQLVGEIRFEPGKVRVSGPERTVRDLDSLPTENRELKGLKRHTEVMLNLEIPPEFALQTSLTQVKALLKVDRLGERTMVGVPLKVANAPADREIILEPSVVDVYMTGPVSLLADIESDEIDAWVDFKNFSPMQSNRLEVQALPGPPVSINKVVPNEVRVIVHR